MDEQPGDGQWLHPKHRKYKESIVFIHHFGGNKSSLFAYARLVNDLGFSALIFTQSHHVRNLSSLHFLTSTASAILSPRGYPGLWKSDLKKQLRTTSDDLIFYSFSSPSMIVPSLISNKRNKAKAWICDGGPFSHFEQCFNNYFTRYLKVSNPTMVKALYLTTYLSWNKWSLDKNLQRELSALPKNFPVLSLKGCKDLLVPPEFIDEVFKDHNHLDITSVNLEKSGHLNGLMMEKEAYRGAVKEFLQTVATPL